MVSLKTKEKKVNVFEEGSWDPVISKYLHDSFQILSHEGLLKHRLIYLLSRFEAGLRLENFNTSKGIWIHIPEWLCTEKGNKPDI